MVKSMFVNLVTVVQNSNRSIVITILLILIVVIAAVAWAGLLIKQKRSQPKYKDCPWCHVTIRYNASICPTCAKFVPIED
ncbi:MAG TPA: hypothetical protein VH186_06680 [Chloroflexia bacterium]|nr:hypothetical protein [Chloroflexia bacterium]